MQLIVDTHEHPDTKRHWEHFKHPYHKGYELAFHELPAGDITTDSMRVGFEFKNQTGGKTDFENSISDGRLPEYQPTKLLQTYQQAYIIVAGTLNIRDNVIRGTIASCFARGVPVIQVPTFHDVMMLTTSILEKCNDGKDRSVCYHNKPKIIDDPQLSVLCGIPGINKERAEVILDDCGSIICVAGASVEELMQIKGIGKKLAATIHGTLNNERSKSKYPEW